MFSLLPLAPWGKVGMLQCGHEGICDVGSERTGREMLNCRNWA